MKFLVLLLFVGVSANFDSKGQQSIVDAHNSLRSQIAMGTYISKGIRKPPASDMLKMSWDTNLESSAQEYAETCPKKHSGTKDVGENIFWIWSTADLGNLNQYTTEATDSWKDEFQKNGWTSNNFTSDLFNTDVGHATQMAWAKSSSVGCGVKTCFDDNNNMNEMVVVCQYKPQGNVDNENIYTMGDTCSACPSATSCELSTGLCV